MPRQPIKTYWQTSDKRKVRLYLGDVLNVLRGLPAGSVQMVVTSPPYWGLRDYGTAEWEGGDKMYICEDCNVILPIEQLVVGCPKCGETMIPYKCDHIEKPRPKKGPVRYSPGGEYIFGGADDHYKDACKKCGAKRIDQQIGSERTPDEFVAKMVEVFGEVRRVLRDDGTLWLNLGDTYSGGGNRSGEGEYEASKKRAEKYGYDVGGWGAGKAEGQGANRRNTYSGNLKPGNLMGMPWRVALALQADGWILRQDIIWSKPSPMPESVRNRCTKSHEYIFLFAKKQGYLYDADAVRESSVQSWNPKKGFGTLRPKSDSMTDHQMDLQRTQFAHNTPHDDEDKSGRNKRSVWTEDGELLLIDWVIKNCPEVLQDFVRSFNNKKDVWKVASESYAGAHFATFPKKLITPCILAGTSAKGACGVCGAPWKRVVEMTEEYKDLLASGRAWRGDEGKPDPGKLVNRQQKGHVSQVPTKNKTIGWQPTCTCNGRFRKRKRVEYVKKSLEGTEEEPGGRDRSMKRNRNALTGSLDNKPRELVRKVVSYVEYVPRIPLGDHPVVPCVVLDPFIGSGTTCCVCIAEGRDSIGIDLSEDYLRKNAVPRIEGELISRPALAHLTGRKAKKLDTGIQI